MPAPRKVALLIETSNAYARDLLHGIRAWQRERGGWTLRLSEQGRGAGVPDWLGDWRGDGVIARVESPAIATALRRRGLPVVDVSAALPEPVFPRVVTDSEAATRLAFEHLRERGFEHFAYCGDGRFHWARQRGEFFRQQVEAAGRGVAEYLPPGGAGAAARRRPGGAGPGALADGTAATGGSAGVLRSPRAARARGV